MPDNVIKFQPKPEKGIIVFGDDNQWAVSQDDSCLRFHPQYSTDPDKVTTWIWREAWLFVTQQGGFDAVLNRLRGMVQ